MFPKGFPCYVYEELRNSKVSKQSQVKCFCPRKVSRGLRKVLYKGGSREGEDSRTKCQSLRVAKVL